MKNFCQNIKHFSQKIIVFCENPNILSQFFSPHFLLFFGLIFPFLSGKKNLKIESVSPFFSKNGKVKVDDWTILLQLPGLGWDRQDSTEISNWRWMLASKFEVRNLKFSLLSIVNNPWLKMELEYLCTKRNTYYRINRPE